MVHIYVSSQSIAKASLCSLNNASCLIHAMIIMFITCLLPHCSHIAQDFPPIADAGDDIEIQLPINKVTLSGDGSSDDIEVVRYQWELLSGDAQTLEIEGEDTANPTVSGLREGPYTFKLTVYDQLGQLDIDEVDITVLG